MPEKKSSSDNKPQWRHIGDQVRIPITALCNQRCAFCHFTSIEDDWDFNPEIIKKNLKTITTERLRLLTFTGGEPTLVPALPDYIKIARSIGIPDIEIETNGLMLSYREYT
ncbi:MAG: radical SAM protein, partial [bacterium]